MKFFYEQFDKLTHSQICVFGETLKTLTAQTEFPFDDTYKENDRWNINSFIRYLEYTEQINETNIDTKITYVTILCTLHKMSEYYENN